ncbi:hypothetical protein D3C71_2173700 [compost metagenome]
MPKLLLSKTDADFDSTFEAYVKDRAAAGFDKLQAYRQTKYEENVKKLAEFLK